MARSDLLISLVRAGFTGDKRSVKALTEAIAAEENMKQHHVLADRLLKEIPNVEDKSLPTMFQTYEGNPRGKEHILEVVPRRSFEDLKLSKNVKSVIAEVVEEHQRASVLRSYNLEPRNKILLVGPPGNGKTTLAEGIAYSLGMSFFVIRYESLVGSYLGETASRLKRVFDYIKSTPCVVFFDEFDTLGKERGDLHETGEIKRVVSSLLLQIDDLPSYNLIIAATNHPELLDKAVWRRFQVCLELQQPSLEEMSSFINERLCKIDKSLKISSKVLENRLGSISYAEAEQFCLDIFRRSVLRGNSQHIKDIIAEQLIDWSGRARINANRNVKRAKLSTSKSAKSHKK